MEEIPERLEEKLKNVESLEETIQACAEEGITVTKEQLEAVLSPEPDGELNEEALDNVSGGGFIDWIRRLFRYNRAPKYSSGNGSGGGVSAGGSGGGGGGSAGGR